MVTESTRQSDRALTFLAGLASELIAVLSLPDLVDRALALLEAEAGFDSCTIALLDDQNPDSLTIVGATGIRADFRGQVIPRGQGLHWAAIASTRPLYVGDMQADPRVLRRDERVRSGIYVTLAVRGEPIGVLSAHRGQVDAFTPDDLTTLAAIARYLEGAFEVSRLHARLRGLATTDTLTGLADRRLFLARLEAELGRTRRRSRPLSVVLLDLDGFKAINDAHGHAVGDTVLIQAAETLRRDIRSYDLAARFGGDEFILMLPETTSLQAEQVLVRIRKKVQKLDVVAGTTHTGSSLSISWGTASFPADGETSDALIRIADTRLNRMKKQS